MFWLFRLVCRCRCVDNTEVVCAWQKGLHPSTNMCLTPHNHDAEQKPSV